MKKLFILTALLCAPALYAAQQYACCAYEETPKYGLKTNTTRVEFYGGVALPEKEWSENGQTLQIGDTGFSAGIAFVRNVLPWLTVGLDGNYAGFSKGDDLTTAAGTVNYRSGVATGLVTGRVYLFPHAMTRLYGTAGLGAGYMYAKEKDASSGDTNKTYDSTDVAWMLGAGLEFDLDETVVFGAEGRYNWVGLRSEMKDRFGHDNYQYWTVMLKLGVKF